MSKKRTKIVLCVGFLLACASISLGADNINWSANGDTNETPLYDESDTQLTGSDLAIQLIIDQDNDTDFDKMMNGWLGIGAETGIWANAIDASGTDDVVLATATWTWYGGYSIHYIGSQVDDTTGYDGLRFYYRWFNDANRWLADEAGVIFNTLDSTNSSSWYTPTGIGFPATAELGYLSKLNSTTGTMYTAGSDDGWQTMAPVPEPGTLALVGMGVLAITMRRRFRKKAR